MNPAEQLEGMDLPGGWTVGVLHTKSPLATGGTFSQCYSVTSADGRRGFLKALDYHSFFGKGEGTIELATRLFNFEKGLLKLCEDRRMDRVVRALSDGEIYIDPSQPFSRVPYLIFEQADKDVRVHLGSSTEEPSVGWKLRCMHHVATGLRQLHGAGIAHQDLKPSNVLVFLVDSYTNVSKIADLGNASNNDGSSPYEQTKWPGDFTYAPPEIQYSQIDPDWNMRRIATDLYLLGSMLSFIFTQTTAFASLRQYLRLQHDPSNWGTSYQEVLPYVRHAFSQAALLFEQSIPAKLAPDLMPVYLQLCEPDPSRRGSPNIAMNKVSLDRFVTSFDLLAWRAAVGRYG